MSSDRRRGLHLVGDTSTSTNGDTVANPTLGSIMLSSTDPDRLHSWYSTVLPPQSEDKMDQYRILGYGGFMLILDSRDDIGESTAEPGRVILNFDVDVARAVAAADRQASVAPGWRRWRTGTEVSLPLPKTRMATTSRSSGSVPSIVPSPPSPGPRSEPP